MRLRPFALATSLALAACSSGSAGDASTTGGAAAQFNNTVGGARPVKVLIPKGYDGATALPLLILLHGYSATGLEQESFMSFGPVAEKMGFFYAHPDGTTDPTSNEFWNATDACCNFGGSTVDDSAYLIGLVDEISSKWKIDPKRVYFVGHSNGGFMSFRMACDHADRIAGIATLAGAMWDDTSKCKAAGPVSLLAIHGTKDAEIAYTGGAIQGHAYPSAATSVADWVSTDGCGTTPDKSGAAFDVDASTPGLETTAAKWSGCKAGTAVELWTMAGSGHLPLPLAPDFATRVATWLLAHPKP